MLIQEKVDGLKAQCPPQPRASLWVNGYKQPTRPVRATVKKQWNIRAALTGRIVRKCLIPRALPWAVESCPFGARCLQTNTSINHSKYRMKHFKFWYLWGNLWQISTSKLKSDMYLPADNQLILNILLHLWQICHFFPPKLFFFNNAVS